MPDEEVLFADAHCHLDLFPDPSAAVMQSAAEKVRTIISCGVNRDEALATSRLADGINVWGVIGIDPTFAPSDEAFIDELEGLFGENTNLVGIGEIGLDATKVPQSPMDVQRRVFERQLVIAKELGRPVVIHARKALQDVMHTLVDKGIENAMFHFFEGDENEAKEAEKHGYIISISPGDSSKKRRVIKALDLTSIVAETDSPIVGKSPVDVIPVVETIAKVKGIDIAEAAEQTTSNVKKFFYI